MKRRRDETKSVSNTDSTTLTTSQDQNVSTLISSSSSSNNSSSLSNIASTSTLQDVSSLVVKFQSMDDNDTPTMTVDVPLDITTEQLNTILTKVLNIPSSSSTPYAFYINNEEIITTLRSTAELQNISSEDITCIRYQPLSIFNVLPVTRCTDTLPGHTDAVLHVSFSPDGNTLASGGGDAIVRFWDVNTCTPRSVCKGHKHHVLCTAWSPDGKLFASGDKNGEIRIWDPLVDNGKCMHEFTNANLTGHSQYVTSLAWEPLHLVTDVSNKCTLLASGSKDNTVRVWNCRTGLLQFVISGHKDSIESIRWSGQGLIYTASRDRTIMVWAVAEDRLSAKLIRTLSGHGHRINSIALNTDYLCRTGAIDPANPLSSTTINSNNNNTSSSDTDSSKQLIQLAKQRYERGLRSMGGIETLVSCSDDFTLYLWQISSDGSKPNMIRMTGHQAAVNHLSFSPDGRYIASASFDKKVKLWDGHNGKFINTFVGHVGPVYQVCWSADSRLFSSASRDSTVKVWSSRVGHADGPKKPVALYTLSGHADEVFALDWSPNGEIMASGGRDRVIKL